MWLYLQIFGKGVEYVLNEPNIWTFLLEDFKSAVACLMMHVDDTVMHSTAIKMKRLISKHFQTDKELIDWSKDALQKVFLQIHMSLALFLMFFSMRTGFQRVIFIFHLIPMKKF